MFRLQENVPEIYTTKSRDFQILCRIYDLVNNASRFNCKSASTLLDPLLANDRILPLLATRIGFFPKQSYNNKALREILSVFPYMIKYKGSKKGIEMAVNAILKGENNYSESNIYIDNINAEVKIYSKEALKNEILLRDVLSYVLPIGYTLVIGTFTDTDKGTSNIKVSESVEFSIDKQEDLSVYLNVTEIQGILTRQITFTGTLNTNESTIKYPTDDASNTYTYTNGQYIKTSQGIDSIIEITDIKTITLADQTTRKEGKFKLYSKQDNNKKILLESLCIIDESLKKIILNQTYQDGIGSYTTSLTVNN